MPQAASAAPRRKLSIRRATIETRAPVVGPTSNLKTRSRSFSDLADIFGAEAREHWLQPLQVSTLTTILISALCWQQSVSLCTATALAVVLLQCPTCQLCSASLMICPARGSVVG